MTLKKEKLISWISRSKAKYYWKPSKGFICSILISAKWSIHLWQTFVEKRMYDPTRLFSFCFFVFLFFIIMGYSRKNPNKRIEGTEFPGFLGYRLWKFQGLIKKEVEFLVVIKKKLCWFLTWNFQGCNIVSQNFRGKLLLVSNVQW